MLRRADAYILASGLLIGAGCHSSSEATKVKSAGSPAAIAQNVTRVEAVIDKKELTDSLHYSLTLFIVSASPVTGRGSLIEPEQHVAVLPQFKTDAVGTIDLADPRNVGLLSVRQKNVGEKIIGTISRNQWGGYSLLTVDSE
jgi:hypothetical protein